MSSLIFFYYDQWLRRPATSGLKLSGKVGRAEHVGPLVVVGLHVGAAPVERDLAQRVGRLQEAGRENGNLELRTGADHDGGDRLDMIGPRELELGYTIL